MIIITNITRNIDNVYLSADSMDVTVELCFQPKWIYAQNFPGIDQYLESGGQSKSCL